MTTFSKKILVVLILALIPLISSTQAHAATVTYQVAASANDANQSGGQMQLSDGTVWVGKANNTSYTGLRFTNVQIPQGATITSAKLSFYADPVKPTQWISVGENIFGEKVANSSAFTTASNNISTRLLTTNSVTHSSNVLWTGGNWYILQDIAPIVQELVGQTGWQQGNALSIIMQGTGNNWARKYAVSYNGNPLYAPKIEITYEGTSQPDTTPPSVSITAPSNGQTVSGNVTVNVTATDNVGVSSVELFLDANLIATDTTAPYSFNLNTTVATDGTHSITATARDAANNTAATNINLTFDNVPDPDTTPPVVAITAPNNNATVSATTNIVATATDNTGVANVEFYVDANLIGSDNTSPYTYSWNTTAVTNGNHTVSARAYDAANNTTENQIVVNVDNAVVQANAFLIGPGGEDVIPHQLVRTAADKVYAVAYEGQYSSRINVHWTTSTGIPNSTDDFAGFAQITEAATVISVDAVYDGINTIHIITNAQDGVVRDHPFDLTTNTFKTPLTLANNAHTVTGTYVGTSGVTGMFDTTGVLHIAYWNTANRINYTAYTYNASTNTLATVDGPTTVDTAGNATHPAIAISPVDNAVTLAWISEATSPARILARTKTGGTWGAVQTLSTDNVWVSTSGGINIDQGPSLVKDTTGKTHLVYMENYDATGDYGRIHYVTDASGAWVDLELDSYTHDPAIAITAANELFILGHGHPNNASCLRMVDMCQIRNTGGTWQNPELIIAATGNGSFDTSPSVKWSIVGFNRPETVEFLFSNVPNGDYDHPELYYAMIQGTSGGQDITPPTTQITSPLGGTTVSGTTTIAATSADNVGVTRVEYYIDSLLKQSVNTTTGAVTKTYTITNDNRDAWAGNPNNGSQNEIRISGYAPNEPLNFVSNDADEEATGMQFAIDIPKNATIINAYITMKAGQFQSPSATGDMEIRIYDDVAINQFENAQGTAGNILALYPLSQGNVRWNAGTAGWTAGTLKQTPDLSSLIQNFVNKTDYQSPTSTGYIGFVFSKGTIPQGTYYGWEDFTAGTAPTLTVTYTSQGASQTSVTSSYNWDTTLETDAMHQITVKSYDAENNSSSASVSVEVDNGVPPVPDTEAPVVTVTSPTNSVTVTGTQNIAATATDNVGVTRVEFYIDTVLAQTDTVSPYEYTWNTTQTTNGLHTLEAKAYDAANNTANNMISVTVNNTIPTSGTVNAKVSASSDDANEDGATFSSADSTVWLGEGQSATASYTGLRFTNITIPQGATITSARLKVKAASTAWINLGFNMFADANGNSATFSSGSKPSSRTSTAAVVPHSSNVQWVSGTTYELNDISPVIQEVVNRGDWQSGNALSIIVKGTQGAWARKYVHSFDGSAANAPELVIDYQL